MTRLFRLLLGVCVSVLLLSVPSAFAAEGEPDLISLSPYKPIYFLMGNPYTKVEFSFKAQVVRNVPLHFGYTQLMMWDLFIPSPYFHDINYNAEIFYRLPIGESLERWIDINPFEHESNGLGGERERSWNRASLRYRTQTRIGLNGRLSTEIKGWVPWYTNDRTMDITRYRGSYEFTFTLSDFLGPFFEVGSLILRVYPGGKSTFDPLKGGQELTFRTKPTYRAFLPLFVAQVFHGVGENLLDLQRDHWGVRAGIGF